MSSNATTTISKGRPAPRDKHAEQASPELTITSMDRPITILIVDDDPDCRLLIRDAIAECKVSNDVHEVSNGQEALDFLNRRGPYASAPRPGLVFLDIEMPPGINGLETLKQVRENPALREIPVVMM